MIDWSRHFLIQNAARLLHGGGVVAYPTEAVWGLGCDPWNEDAVHDLLALKHRPERKGLILLAADMAQLDFLLEGLEADKLAVLRQSWPGPVTWLIPHRGLIPRWISGQFDSVAVRVTDHPVAAGLSRAFGGPIVSTSANPQGKPPARVSLDLRRYFGQRLAAVTPGQVGGRRNPSEIRDLLTGKTLRSSA